ncbi:hypothetical protein NVV95_04150 [Herbiconiux sp. CPCC 205716]|uniref:MmyB-like transcription regulator ligand binding domain-containing protein n=1 Tax=Herbiconiux gentiana TaxID=2970912 RepID=A0ABT2GC35_9MICO|nr:hypothetical protein [Herbiconiux gentiana]MCS5713742.1 hypothetical protein [Herbiconiux gentiana]
MTDDRTPAGSREAIRQLVTSWPATPAFLCDRYFTVVVSNRLAEALTPAFHEGANLASFTFLDPTIDRDHARYTELSRQTVALLRGSLDEHRGDATFRSIVGNLSVRSDDFAAAWADDELRALGHGSAVFPHTAQGTIELTYQLLLLPDDSGDSLFVWAPADPQSERTLTRLADALPS